MYKRQLVTLYARATAPGKNSQNRHRKLAEKIPRIVTENLQKIAETGRVDKCTSTEYSTGTVHSTVPEYQYEYTVLVQYQYSVPVLYRTARACWSVQ